MITDTRNQPSPAETPTRPVPGAGIAPHVQVRHPGAMVVWLLMVGGFLLFVAVGTVTLGAGSRQGAQARVVDVWRGFIAALPEVGNATLLQFVVYGAIAAVLGLSALGLWLALTASDRVAESSSGEHGAA